MQRHWGRNMPGMFKEEQEGFCGCSRNEGKEVTESQTEKGLVSNWKDFFKAGLTLPEIC